MTSAEIRKTFLDFFESKEHKIIDSAPMVVKDDPTLMFTNAGMNQFKEIFLGETKPESSRIADTQKCLRVSGKHNDLEEVGVDTFHHTMFEMLGNWSFGDYYKKEAIEWAWELLVDVYKIDKANLYVTIFEGDKADNLPYDKEAYDYWKEIIDDDRILKCSKQYNFWEMGEIGPCGPCSEIHIDIRTDAEKKKVDGKSLINSAHPQVIEIWNLVFIEFNRSSDGKLENLSQKHVDTGMGFERLCMVIQNKVSNYDADVFESLIEKVEKLSGKTYGQDESIDVAIRVAVDHVRAVAFSIADGQLPANVKAGYVIRRILRRAVRYGYTHLGIKTPFLFELVSVLAKDFKDIFPELNSQKDLISKVIKEEEVSFLKTLEVGLKRIDEVIHKSDKKVIDGNIAFELYDTYGFPLDLTQLIAKENGFSVDEKVFDEEMSKQRDRARQATKVETGDWEVIKDTEVEFVGYEQHESEAEILKYRNVKSKNKEAYQIVFSPTPFYAESGGQVGDTGYLETKAGEKIAVLDTQKENNLIVHFTDKIPEKVDLKIKAVVNYGNRVLTANNHSATHLLHAALRHVIGDHVQQKGSLVDADHLRFDFSHFQKVTDDELKEIDCIVNKRIRENIQLDEKREVPFDDAVKLGATALFGEKYGDKVRVITFDPEYSVELCGGIHVNNTSQIGLFKIISESAIAAGVRRIEAITAEKAEGFINNELETLTSIRELFKNPNDLLERVNSLIKKNNDLQKELEGFTKNKIGSLKESLIKNCNDKGDVNFIAEIVDLPDSDAVKSLSFDLKKQVDNLFLVLGAKFNGKAHISVMLSDNLVKDKGWKANEIIKELASEIQGGGGGQAFFASAGGKDPGGLQSAMDKARKIAEG